MNTTLKWLLVGWLLGACSIGLVACKLSNASSNKAAATTAKPGKSAKDDEHGPELAHYMSWLQRYAQKAGFAIRGKNKRLAYFYMHEMEETLEDVMKHFVVHDGKPIGKLAKVMLMPSLERLEKSLKAPKVPWKKAWNQYKAVINSCNACHTATGYAFLKMTPANGPVPFNQVFKASSP
jgi:hypothetical protein